jgi:hypothetical protein
MSAKKQDLGSSGLFLWFFERRFFSIKGSKYNVCSLFSTYTYVELSDEINELIDPRSTILVHRVLAAQTIREADPRGLGLAPETPTHADPRGLGLEPIKRDCLNDF